MTTVVPAFPKFEKTTLMMSSGGLEYLYHSSCKMPNISLSQLIILWFWTDSNLFFFHYYYFFKILEAWYINGEKSNPLAAALMRFDTFGNTFWIETSVVGDEINRQGVPL